MPASVLDMLSHLHLLRAVDLQSRSSPLAKSAYAIAALFCLNLASIFLG